jgi:hypothetical protein
MWARTLQRGARAHPVDSKRQPSASKSARAPPAHVPREAATLITARKRSFRAENSLKARYAPRDGIAGGLVGIAELGGGLAAA